MSTLDLICLLILAILAGRGIWRGGISEIIETAGTIGAAILTYKLYPTVAGIVGLPTGGSIFKVLGGFLAAFLIVMLALTLLGHWLKKLFRKISLGTLDRAIGGILGFVKGAILVAAIAWCLNWVGGEGRQWLDESPIAKMHLRVAGAIVGDVVKKESVDSPSI